MCKVTETIPLRSTLSVQGVEIIISNTWVEDFYIMFEFFPTERGYFWDIEWKTKDVRARISVKRE
jgi:hypothetical protein